MARRVHRQVSDRPEVPSPVKATSEAAPRHASATHSGNTILGVEPGGSGPLGPTQPTRPMVLLRSASRARASHLDCST